MKCWKCGAEIPAGASVCTYCSASTIRKNPVTAAGKAMRQIYDRFGCVKVFDKKSILPTALGDLLEDSRKLRGHVEMAMSADIGSIYTNQVRIAGKPDSAFYARIKTLITEEAGLSDKIAKELMGYFDEMIGWNGTIQTVSPGTSQSTSSSGGNATNYHQPHDYGQNSNRTSNKEIPRPAPSNPTPSGGSTTYIPYLFSGVPNGLIPSPLLGGSNSFAHNCAHDMLRIRLAGQIARQNPPDPTKPVLDAKTGLPTAMVPHIPEAYLHIFPRLICTYKNGILEVCLYHSLNKFALAIDDKWIATGSGNIIKVSVHLPHRSNITVAEITDSGILAYGNHYFENR